MRERYALDAMSNLRSLGFVGLRALTVAALEWSDREALIVISRGLGLPDTSERDQVMQVALRSGLRGLQRVLAGALILDGFQTDAKKCFIRKIKKEREQREKALRESPMLPFGDEGLKI